MIDPEPPGRHRIKLPGGVILDVRGLPEAMRIYQDYDAVLSLQDPSAEVAWGPHPLHWIFRVRDIEKAEVGAPSLDLVREILGLDIGEAKRILVHCQAGLSRSVATAILIATQRGMSEDALLDSIDWTHAFPNRRVIEFGETILGTRGRLMAMVERGLKRGGWS